jgi:hypothetical protein
VTTSLLRNAYFLLQRSGRIKTQTERGIAFYAEVREKEIASEREREREKETRIGREW